MSSISNSGYENKIPNPYEDSLDSSSESHSDPIPSNFEKTFLAQYEMQNSARKLLGQGQYKAVFLLTNPSGKKLAQQTASFTKQASTIENTSNTLKSLKLKGTVKIFGVHNEQGNIHIMTKYYNLGDLDAYAKDLPKKEKLELLIKAFGSVKELNEFGIQHRDIKANNFLVHRKKNGQIKVVLADPDCIQGRVRKNTLYNSLLAPPELLDSDSTHDLWMCGLMTVMFLTGKSEKDLPWYKDFANHDINAVKKLKKELTSFFDKIDDSQIRSACQKAMNPNNTRRGTLGQLTQTLRQVINRLPSNI